MYGGAQIKQDHQFFFKFQKGYISSSTKMLAQGQSLRGRKVAVHNMYAEMSPRCCQQLLDQHGNNVSYMHVWGMCQVVAEKSCPAMRAEQCSPHDQSVHAEGGTGAQWLQSPALAEFVDGD